MAEAKIKMQMSKDMQDQAVQLRSQWKDLDTTVGEIEQKQNDLIK
jgi:hypothetical protein